MVKRLYELSYDRSEVLNLFRFVDWVMILPEGLKRTFWDEMKTYEEERKMPCITSVEEIGYDRGKTEEAQSLILRLLNRKLGVLPDRTMIESTSYLSLVSNLLERHCWTLTRSKT